MVYLWAQGRHRGKLGKPHQSQKKEQLVTLEVSQLAKSCSNQDAFVNMDDMSVTCAVEEKFSVEAKLVALENIPLIEVTAVVSIVIGWLRLRAFWNMLVVS